MYTYLIILFRVVTIMSVLLITTLIISGRRTIGELPVFDLLITIVIGAITGADIANLDIHHLNIIFAIIVTYSFQRLLNLIYLKSKFFRKMITFPPIILVQDGKMVYKNIKKIRYSIDEVLMLLRQNEVFDIDEVKYAILESDGEMSILRRNNYIKSVELNYTIIMDGKLLYNNLKLLNITEDELLQLLRQQGFSSFKEIFFASIDNSRKIYLSPYNVKCDNI